MSSNDLSPSHGRQFNAASAIEAFTAAMRLEFEAWHDIRLRDNQGISPRVRFDRRAYPSTCNGYRARSLTAKQNET